MNGEMQTPMQAVVGSLPHIVQGIANMVLALLLAPLCEGILRKVTAIVQSRQGPPIRQPYFDLFKLLGKEDIEVGETPGMQRFAAYLSLATLLMVAAFLPMGNGSPMNYCGDVILLVYLLTLVGVATLLAGLAAGSTYSLVGMSREMMAMITLEPILAIAILVGAIHTHSLRLDIVLANPSVYSGVNFPWSGVIMLVLLLFSLQAFVGRLPFDTCEAETEIMEGSLMEYSGPKLALFKYTHMMKLFVYSGIFVSLFIPWGHTDDMAMNLVIYLVKVLAVVLLITLVAATHARYRIDQAIRYYACLFGLGLVALILAAIGH
jgi:formate hydrogenlyase subunit 4